MYIECGLYTDQVSRYLGRFGDRVHALFFEDFIGDEARAIAEVHAFLGLRPGGGDRESRRMNPSSLPRNRLSRALLASGRVRTLARAAVPRRLRSGLRGALLKQAAPPPMDPDARALLTEVFRPEVARLGALLKTAPPWSQRP